MTFVVFIDGQLFYCIDITQRDDSFLNKVYCIRLHSAQHTSQTGHIMLP
jgi:hypothetical protein